MFSSNPLAKATVADETLTIVQADAEDEERAGAGRVALDPAQRALALQRQMETLFQADKSPPALLSLSLYIYIDR